MAFLMEAQDEPAVPVSKAFVSQLQASSPETPKMSGVKCSPPTSSTTTPVSETVAGSNKTSPESLKAEVDMPKNVPNDRPRFQKALSAISMTSSQMDQPTPEPKLNLMKKIDAASTACVDDNGQEKPEPRSRFQIFNNLWSLGVGGSGLRDCGSGFHLTVRFNIGRVSEFKWFEGIPGFSSRELQPNPNQTSK
jgi:hypothetical protein